MALEKTNGDKLAFLSQRQLIWMRFNKHKLAVAGMYSLAIIYTLALFAEFFAPYTSGWKDLGNIYTPPQTPRLSIQNGIHIHGIRRQIDPITFKSTYVEDRSVLVPLAFFVKGPEYKLWGILPANRHFFGVDMDKFTRMNPVADIKPAFYLLGADKYGRDIFSRIVYGARVSLFLGLFSIMITFVLGIAIGGVSGYIGGGLDIFIQRTIEILNCIPRLPLWIAMSAAVPPEWSALRVYFAITVLLSLLHWTGLARVVRGKMLSLREEDYTVAAMLLGASHFRIIFRHLVPGFASHIIVSITMSIPTMILGETSLSFLGLGLRPPVVSWGVMLQDCMNMQTVVHYPWIMMPMFFLILLVLSFNFMGDGLRDAADPYSSR